MREQTAGLDVISSVGMVARSSMNAVLLDTARHMRDKHGIAVHVYCESLGQAKFFEREAGDVFATITTAPNPLETRQADALDREEVLAKAREIEKLSGITLNTIAVGDRVLGAGYSVGGTRTLLPSEAQQISYLQMVDRYVQDIEFWRREFQSHEINLLLVFAGPAGAKQAAVACRICDVTFRALSPSRVTSYYAWFVNEFYESSLIKDEFDRLSDAVDAVVLDEAYREHVVGRKIFMEAQKDWFGLPRQIGYAAQKHVRLTLRGTPTLYRLSDVFRSIVHTRRSYRRLSVTGRQLEDLRGERFVFFPLQLEPEPALGQLSPEFFSQMTAIASVSRDLPAGALLVVKEHLSAIGKRPTDFYLQLSRLKNVVLMDPQVYGLDVIKAACGVATINSSAGFEAAAMGKPVIVFGRHNPYDFLSHVTVVTPLGDAAPALTRAIEGDFDVDRARRDGARFLQAVINTSFDLQGYDLISASTLPPGAGELSCSNLAATLTA